MVDATVTKLNVAPTTTKKSATKQKPVVKTEKHVAPRTAMKLRWQFGGAMFLGAIATGMTCVSVDHLAHTAMHFAHVPTWQGWAMGIGIDLNYIGMEFATIVAAHHHVRLNCQKWTRWAIPCVMVLSAACNVLEMTREATDVIEVAVSAAWGVFLPALVYVTGRVAAALADI